MKKILSLLSFVVVLSACTGDTGPAGPPGPQGPPGDGESIIGSVFEAEVDFTSPDYSVFVEIPSSIEVFESDVIMVYLLETVDEDSGADVWSPLPQTFFLEDGQLQYNFNHTDFDVNIYLQGNVNLDNLGTEFTNNQIFRIAVLPADFAENTGIDIGNLNAVMNALEMSSKDVEPAARIQ